MTSVAMAQQPPGNAISLPDLQSFQPTGANWQMAGEVTVNPMVNEDFHPVAGQSLIVNLPDANNRANLVTKQSFGDLDMDFDFMMAPGSNSGIYLLGLYEIQLRDSWGVAHPAYSDCGGVYERWNDANKGNEGFEGTAPYYNACKAPGLWQHMHISFQAARFDGQGKKIEQARVISVTLNGIEVVTEVALTGPTRGAMFAEDKATGPVLIQGDHGAVAFRNIQIQSFDQMPPTVGSWTYEWSEWAKSDAPDWSTLKAQDSGSTPALTWEVSRSPDFFAMKLKATMKVQAAGSYHFVVPCRGGVEALVDGKSIFPYRGWGGEGTLNLLAGEHSLEIRYQKGESWYSPGLGLFIEGPGFRMQQIHGPGSLTLDVPVAPILVHAQTTPYILRCFIDYPGPEKHRIVHAANVGDAAGLNYTMDLDNGALVMMWRGDFMDATPMWHDRGDGSALPLGVRMTFPDKAAFMQGNSSMLKDSVNDYHFYGYALDDAGFPDFHYRIQQMEVHERPKSQVGGKGLDRNVTWSNGPSDAKLVLAQGAKISRIAMGCYMVGDHEYYVQVPETKKIKAGLDAGSSQTLSWPVSGSGSFSYSILW